MSWLLDRRAALRLTSAGAATLASKPTLAQRGFSTGANTAVYQSRAVAALQMPSDVVAAALRRASVTLQDAAAMLIPRPPGGVEIQASTIFQRRWNLVDSAGPRLDLLEMGIAIASQDAVNALVNAQVQFRCISGCAFGGVAIYLFKGRACDVAVISRAKPGAFPRTLTVSKDPET